MRIVAALLLVTCLAACGANEGPASEPTAYLEREIQPKFVEQAEEALGESLDFVPVIECPENAPQAVGTSFECFIYDEADTSKAPVSFIKISFPNEDEYQWRTISD